MAYNDIISRDASNDPLIPTPVSAQILQEMPTESFILQRAGQVRMSTKSQRQPVLDVLPRAYWVSGDTGLKQTSAVDWKNVTLVAEELAVIVPIPEAYLDDAQVPIWDEVRPRIVEALGKAIDSACLFGVDKPSSWPADIYSSVVAAGNTVRIGTGEDFGVDVANLGEKIAKDGFAVNGFASRPGLKWKLVGLRSTDGIPIYQPDLQNGGGGNLYGYGLSEVINGSWDSDEAELIAGDWSKCVIGMRQDMSWKTFTEGVISDADGKVILNLMQQDSMALRVVMRLGYATSNPVTALNTDANTRFPFGAVQAATADNVAGSA
ncbi:phage major capsid protein [Actinomadura rubrisoli]|uniref:Phage major capsid protein n=1 Tax=Actinomadura rubrisoli TaxID=2530368 RepID=A0A4R5CCC0_9ACTN|nr:phage major capsid protein [Actinomadura rubrisoli]TDD97638.1 phage major capsid protein [Actinomadura rubrisoli]